MGTPRSVAITLVGISANPISAIVTAPTIARELGVSDRGLLAAATVALSLAVSVCSVGVPTAVTHFVANRRISLRRIACYSILLTAFPVLAASLGLYSILPLVSTRGTSISGISQIVAVAVLPNLACGVIQGVMAGLGEWRLVAIDRAVAALSRLILVVALAQTGGLNVTTAVAITVAAPAIGSLSYLFKIKHIKVALRSRDADAMSGVRLFGGYAAMTWVGVLAGSLLMRLDQFLLAPLAGLSVLGLYAVAVTVSEIVLVANNALREVLFTKFSSEPGGAEVSRLARQSTVLTALIAVPICLAAPVLVPLAFGTEFAGAALPTAILCAGTVFCNPGSIASVGLASLSYPGLRSISLAFGLLSNVLALFILAPYLGATGAAVASVLGNFASSQASVKFFVSRTDQSWAAVMLPRPADVRALLKVSNSLLKRA